MSLKYNFSETAALKVLLHASRHPSSSICGLFLGTPSEGEVRVVDTIPLFHTQASLGPCLEVALIQVTQLAKTSSLEVVGFYEADAQVTASSEETSTTGRMICDRLQQHGFTSCSLFVMDNTKFGDLMEAGEQLPFKVFGKTVNAKWSRSSAAGSSGLVCESTELGRTMKRQLAGKMHYLVFDFDDHLDDVTRDWRNVGLQWL